jgi:gluconate kinase
MKANMLKSQFETLEEPEDAIIVDASLPVETIIEKLSSEIRLLKC